MAKLSELSGDYMDAAVRLRAALDGVRAAMEACPHVSGVHHLHIWAMSTTANALTAHVVIDSLDSMEQAKAAVKAALAAEGIAHSTLEMETEDCHCADLGLRYGD